MQINNEMSRWIFFFSPNTQSYTAFCLQKARIYFQYSGKRTFLAGGVYRCATRIDNKNNNKDMQLDNHTESSRSFFCLPVINLSGFCGSFWHQNLAWYLQVRTFWKYPFYLSLTVTIACLKVHLISTAILSSRSAQEIHCFGHNYLYPAHYLKWPFWAQLLANVLLLLLLFSSIANTACE